MEWVWQSWVQGGHRRTQEAGGSQKGGQEAAAGREEGSRGKHPEHIETHVDLKTLKTILISSNFLKTSCSRRMMVSPVQTATTKTSMWMTWTWWAPRWMPRRDTPSGISGSGKSLEPCKALNNLNLLKLPNLNILILLNLPNILIPPQSQRRHSEVPAKPGPQLCSLRPQDEEYEEESLRGNWQECRWGGLCR